MSTARSLDSFLDPATASLPLGGLLKTIVYGPVINSTFGNSLGVNILGSEQKICSFDCPYCELGTTTVRLNRLKRGIQVPSAKEIQTALSGALERLHQSGPTFEAICISGNGEPTLHPEFVEVIESILQTRDLRMPGKPIRIFLNGSSLDNRKVIEIVNRLDGRVLKLDAGNESIFKMMNSPLSRANLSRIIAGARALKDFSIQSTFVQGLCDNTSTADVDDWIEAIALMKPKQVQIGTLLHQPAVNGVLRCSEDALDTIVSRLERKTQLRATIRI